MGPSVDMEDVMEPDHCTPFSIRLLESTESHGSGVALTTTEHLQPLLPATYRDPHDRIWSPAEDVSTYVDSELDLTRLARIHGWLKIAGRPMMPRPLHYQLFHGRDIIITERMDLHLVWTAGRIFIKPLPRCLLEPLFWDKYLNGRGEKTGHLDGRDVRRGRALGFLKTYAALVAHESDFHIAKEKRLIPSEVGWPQWRTFVEQLLHTLNHSPATIDPRFRYGELRLGRLNKIHYLWETPLRRYVSRWNQYGSFFADNFVWLASATIIIAVVLNALQVGLDTDALKDDANFQAASYGFTVFALVMLASVAGLVLIQFCYLFVDNVFATVKYFRRRLARDSRRGPRGAV